jgi:chitodextrinase
MIQYQQLLLTCVLLSCMTLTACDSEAINDFLNPETEETAQQDENEEQENDSESQTTDQETDQDANEQTNEDNGSSNTDQTDTSGENTEPENTGSENTDSNETEIPTEVDEDTTATEIQLSARLSTTSSWQGGYNGELIITNNTLLSLNDWNLVCSSDIDMVSMWNARYQFQQQNISISPESWSREIPARQNFTIGFSANGSLTENALSSCQISGYDVSVQITTTGQAVDNEETNTGGSIDENNEGTTATSSVVKLSDLEAREAQITSFELMDEVKRSIATLDNNSVEAILALRAENPANVRRVESIMPESAWDYYFPRRAEEYSYVRFLKAVGKFPAFCADYNDGRDADAICRKSLATMFAHFTQETGGHTNWWEEEEWRQGLHYIREMGWNEDMANGYGICDPDSWQAKTWPCSVYPEGHENAGQYKSYFGRGAKQLSYNYNYGSFSQAMYGDVTVLLNDPELVADTWLNLASAVFFYVYPQPPKPSMLHVIDGTWQPNETDRTAGLIPGFGVTTQIINGGVECGGSSENIQSRNRINYYRGFTAQLGVAIADDEILGCANMQQFDGNGTGALPIYWEQSWTAKNECKLVGYQTAYSAFTPGDYAKCVENYFDVEIVDE